MIVRNRHCLLIGIIFSLMACAAPVTPTGPRLPGSEWVLTSLRGEDLVPGTNITMSFTELELFGYAGCNSYSASYQAVGNELQVGLMESTLQLCQEPPAVMDQEETYLEAVRRAATYQAAEDTLSIRNGAGEETLVYTRRVPADMDPASLVGTMWRLAAINQELPLGPPSTTLAFPRAGHMSGFAGCRNYEARYEAEGDAIRVTFIQMLETDCGGSQEMQLQEAEYTTHLELASHYRLAGNELDLYTARGDVLRFEAMP